MSPVRDGWKKSRVSSLNSCMKITNGLAQQKSTCLSVEGPPKKGSILEEKRIPPLGFTHIERGIWK